MIEDFLSSLAESHLLARAGGLLRKLPYPFANTFVGVGDVKLCAHTYDRFAALWLWKWGLLEKFELGLIRSLALEGAQVVDIGANIGLYTLIFSKMERIISRSRNP